MARRKAIRHSKSFWDKHVKLWQESGLTQSEYCRRNNNREKAFGRQKVSRCGTDKKKTCSSQKLDLVALPINLTQDLTDQPSFGSGLTYPLEPKLL
jgi:hypothetical protein